MKEKYFAITFILVALNCFSQKDNCEKFFVKEGKQSKKSVVAQIEIISELSKNINKVYELNNDMTNERAIANKLDDAHHKALAYNKKVKGLFDDIRECCDEIERLVDDSDWVLPKYRELLSLN